MSDIVIRAEDLGKRYSIRNSSQSAGYSTFRESVAQSLRSFIHRLNGGQRQYPPQDDFWALKHVCFEVNRGEVVGIIGRNGAGKSTLLKVLSRITEPTEGRITIDGRVASLLEVGTGFHPELSGRENVYLNGSILGMSRSEVRQKFDAIVAFAEVERFLDTPVKRYSSGMYTRLAFAVAAHLETDILIVDEVLAVGDTNFQKKCLGKIGEVAKGGRTVLFVSHNIGMLTATCGHGLLLESGTVRARGNIRDVARAYLTGNGSDDLDKRAFSGPLKSVVYEQLELNGLPLTGGAIVSPSEPLCFVARGHCSQELPDYRASLSIYGQGVRLLTIHDIPDLQPMGIGRFELTFHVPSYFLRPGEYAIALGGRRAIQGDWIWASDLSTVQVSAEWVSGYEREDHGLVNLPSSGTRRLWTTPNE